MTAANARHHLAILLAEGVIQAIGARKDGRSGRPTNIYALSKPLSRHNLADLAHALMVTLEENIPAEQTPQALKELAVKLAAAPPQLSRNPTQRISAAVKRLNEMHYQARWEAHAQAPRLIFQHCPYAAILPRHPELCQVDAFILENLLGAPVSLVDRLVPSELGLPQCIFRMNR